MVVTIAGIGILIIIILISGIILERVPGILSISESEIPELSYQDSFYKKLFIFLSSRQKIITIAIITKAIRRLKIISLKTDNLSTKLLEKIRSNDMTRGQKRPE